MFYYVIFVGANDRWPVYFDVKNNVLIVIYVGTGRQCRPVPPIFLGKYHFDLYSRTFY